MKQTLNFNQNETGEIIRTGLAVLYPEYCGKWVDDMVVVKDPDNPNVTLKVVLSDEESKK